MILRAIRRGRWLRRWIALKFKYGAGMRRVWILSQVHDVGSFVAFVVREHVSCDAAIIIFRVANNLGCGASSMVKVSGKSGGTSQLGRANPLFIVCNRKFVGCFEPRGIYWCCGSLGFFCIVNGKNHGGQERRLRARKIVSSIGIQDRAVVLDLKKEVFDH